MYINVYKYNCRNYYYTENMVWGLITFCEKWLQRIIEKLQDSFVFNSL